MYFCCFLFSSTFFSLLVLFGLTGFYINNCVNIIFVLVTKSVLKCVKFNLIFYNNKFANCNIFLLFCSELEANLYYVLTFLPLHVYIFHRYFLQEGDFLQQ